MHTHTTYSVSYSYLDKKTETRLISEMNVSNSCEDPGSLKKFVKEKWQRNGYKDGDLNSLILINSEPYVN